MVISYKVNAKIEPHQLAKLYRDSGLRRPVDDLNRLKKMIDNATLLVTAWDGDRLVGIARALTDQSYSCYLCDIAVDKEYQNKGIGHDLINQVEESIGEECSLVLLSPTEVMEYFPKLGFEKTDNAFIIPRKR